MASDLDRAGGDIVGIVAFLVIALVLRWRLKNPQLTEKQRKDIVVGIRAAVFFALFFLFFAIKQFA